MIDVGVASHHPIDNFPTTESRHVLFLTWINIKRKHIRFSFEICHLLESQSGLVSILVPKVVIHAEVSLPAKLITRLTVRDTLNYTTLEEKHSLLHLFLLEKLFLMY